jgi:hypothetical protein
MISAISKKPLNSADAQLPDSAIMNASHFESPEYP